jgi:gas vesicle protein
MAQEESNGRLIWLVAGAAIGAAVALLYAPASGADTRKYLGDKTPRRRTGFGRVEQRHVRSWAAIFTNGAASWPTKHPTCSNAAATSSKSRRSRGNAKPRARPPQSGIKGQHEHHPGKPHSISARFQEMNLTPTSVSLITAVPWSRRLRR